MSKNAAKYDRDLADFNRIATRFSCGWHVDKEANTMDTCTVYPVSSLILTRTVFIIYSVYCLLAYCIYSGSSSSQCFGDSAILFRLCPTNTQREIIMVRNRNIRVQTNNRTANYVCPQRKGSHQILICSVVIKYSSVMFPRVLHQRRLLVVYAPPLLNTNCSDAETDPTDVYSVQVFALPND